MNFRSRNFWIGIIIVVVAVLVLVSVGAKPKPIPGGEPKSAGLYVCSQPAYVKNCPYPARIPVRR